MRGAEAREGLEAFYARAYPRLVGALGLYCGDRRLAEELAQEALLRACSRWRVVGGLASPIGWAYRVGVNLANSHFRRRRAERRAHARTQARGVGVHHDPDVADHVAVRDAVAELTPKQRDVIMLRFYLDLSADQAGAVLGVSADAVRSLTYRAVGALRSSIGDDLVALTEEDEYVP